MPADLDPLFDPPPDSSAQPLSYRQGVIVAFDLVTGDNVVSVGGAVLNDLPLLGIAEAATLAPGSVVGIVSTGREYAILGRFARPNTADYGKALTQLGDATQASFDSGTGTLTGGAAYIDLTGAAVGPTVNINIGLSGKLLVTVGCMAEYDNGPGPTHDQIMGFRMTTAASGANSWSGDGRWALIHYDQSLDTATGRNGGTRASAVHLFSGLNPGLTTITAKYNMPTAGSGTGTARDRLLVAQAL